MKKFILMFSLAFSTAAFADNGFEEATKHHAQSTAREFISSMVDQLAKGYSWRAILGSQTPEKFSDSCGYRQYLAIPDRNFEAMKKEILPFVGDRLVKTYEGVLGKPNARLALVTVKSQVQNSGNYATVVLKTVPGSPKDPFFSLVYQLGDNGQMELCDISTTDQVGGGILQKLGRDLGR